MAATGNVDGRREGHRRRHRRVLCSACRVHGAGHPAEEPARRRVPHHHQAPKGLLAPGLTLTPQDLCVTHRCLHSGIGRKQAEAYR